MAHSLESFEAVREKLSWLVSRPPAPSAQLPVADILIVPNEVNGRHGTGVLLMKMFGDGPEVFCIRSSNYFGGEHCLGKMSASIHHHHRTRPQVYTHLAERLMGITPRRILCVPYLPDDVITAVALKDMFQVPLCTWIMDDQNVVSPSIPNALMEELLTKTDLFFTISPEMRDAYEAKYRRKAWILPPFVTHSLIKRDVQPLAPHHISSRTGIMIGNVWGEKWLQELRRTISGAGITLHWYCNGGLLALNTDAAALARDGIIYRDAVPEPQLANLLRKYPFTIIPSGNLEDAGSAQSIAKLSLPSRVPFILASSHTPMIVLGSPETCVARFVKRFEIGVCVPYDAKALGKAVTDLIKPEVHRAHQARAAALAPVFSDQGVQKWLWESLEEGQPIDKRYESIFTRDPAEFAYYIVPPAPKHLDGDRADVYLALDRLRNLGWTPDFVLDVGASTGVWSHSISTLYPKARFVLVDPLFDHYDQEALKWYTKVHSQCELVKAAVSNQPGRTKFNIGTSLYRSSLLRPSDSSFENTVEVEIITLDKLDSRLNLQGRGLAKIDVQCAEHLVLEGAKAVLKKIDVVILELSLVRLDEQGKLLLEMLNLMDSLGYTYYDDMGEWRSPADGSLIQKDCLFVRRGSTIAH